MIDLFVQILPDDIRQALLDIVECCISHDYLLAMQQYIKLAIGNEPMIVSCASSRCSAPIIHGFSPSETRVDHVYLLCF
jgi:hypothetical protein